MSKKYISRETIAIKKMRELKGLSRKEAGALLGMSHKFIEKFENGRGHLSQEKIKLFMEGYGYTESEFNHICQGKLHLIRDRQTTRKEKNCNQKIRRSYKKMITKETQALVSLRLKKGLTQYEASRICGYPPSAIGHIENGRIELRIPRIQFIVKTYGFTMSEFEKEVKSELRYGDLLQSCLILIKKLDDKKLMTVHQLLQSFSL